MTPDTQAAIEAVRRALEAGPTPGEWKTNPDPHWCRQVRDSDGNGIAWCGGFPEERARQLAAYIAATSPANVSLLLAALDEQKALLERAREGFMSEQATGLPVKAGWREHTLAKLNAALATKGPEA